MMDDARGARLNQCTPTTLAGVKRLAKQIKKLDHRRTHHDALQVAARQAGFATYAEAQRALA